MNSPLKSVEHGFRRLLLSALRLVARARPSGSPHPDIPKAKILFIRQDRIGDVLVSTPLFSALKRHYPDVTLDILLSTNNAFVLDNAPAIRKRWIYRKRFWSSLRTLQEIRREHYDYVVDLMDNPSATSTVILLLAGGKRTVGLAKENSYACDIVVPLKSRKESHIVDRLAQLLTVFSIDPDGEDLRIEYRCSSDSERHVDEVLRASGAGTATLAGINISAGSETRFWGVENYRRLLAYIRQKYPDFRMILLTKPSDRERARMIQDGARDVLIPPETTFDGFAAWIKRCALLVTPDTSAVHLAAAFRVPAIVLYVQSNPELRIWEPYGTPSEALVTADDDLATIQAGEVFNALDRLVLSEVRRAPQRRVGG